MKYLFVILHTNREDLLDKAINSIPSDIINHGFDSIKVMWNSHEDMKSGFAGSHLVTLVRPTYPLTYTQSVNYFARECIKKDIDVLIVMHEDAELEEPQDFYRFIEAIEQLRENGTRWGQVLTSYDILTAYNVKMFKNIGFMDEFFTLYFADWDLFRRMKLSNYAVFNTEIKVIHNNGGSNTFKASEELTSKNLQTFPHYQDYYVKKWGGMAEKEVFETPFNL